MFFTNGIGFRDQVLMQVGRICNRELAKLKTAPRCPPKPHPSMGSFFPPAYARWLAPRLPGELNETLATCDSCAMVKPSGLTRDPGPFDAHLKCCTYFPFIPNFIWGALLAESAATGVRLALASQQGILLPAGLYATGERQGREGFGRETHLLCPFYDTRADGCSIWSHRPGVCTTYFCKSVRGAEGLEFWNRVENYLNEFEWVLATEVLTRLGLGENELAMSQAALSAEESERPHFVAAAWGSWFHRRDEFFREAARVAALVTPADLGAWLSEEALALEALLPGI